MPVTDLSGDDWLQQYLAGYAGAPGGGPATWPPYGGHSTNYGPPNPLGAGAPQPAQSAPDPNASALGWSLTSNPLTRGLAALNPIGAANASVLHPNAGAPAQPPSQPLPPGAANSLPLAFGNPTSADYRNWLNMQLANSSPPAAPATAPPAKRTDAAYGPYDDPGAPAPIGDYVSRVGNYPSWPTTAARPVVGSPGPSIANAPLPPRRPSSFGGQTPGVGAPQGQPSQTPRPPKSSNPFGTVQYQVPGSGVGPLSRNPIYTTLNLFGGR